MNFFNTVFSGAPKGVAIKRIPPDGLEGQRLSQECMSGAPKQTSAGAVCSRQVRYAACSCMTRATPRVTAALRVGLQRLQRPQNVTLPRSFTR